MWKSQKPVGSDAKLFKLDGVNPASFQPVVVVAARLLASPILQEYDASTVELNVHPAEFGKLAARHNLVEIAEASSVWK